MSTPYKDPKSGVYKLRKAVPEDVREIIGSRMYQRTLSTKDIKEAKRLFPEALAEWEKMLEAARSHLEGRSYRLSDREASALAGAWLEAELQEIVDLPDATDIDQVLSVYQDWIEQKDYSRWSRKAQLAIELSGLPILPSSEAFKKLCKVISKADVRYWAIMRSRSQGDWTDAGVDAYPKLTSMETGLRLSELNQRLALEEHPGTRRINDFKRNIERFIEVNSDLEISRIKPSHVVAWKDTMVDRGLASATTNKRISVISSLLGYAARNKLIESNPATGIRARGSKKASNARLSFSKDDLDLLFSGPVHSLRVFPKGGQGEASYWLPLLSLYSGARLGELAQLTVADIGEIEGVAYFDVNRENGKTTKNANSIRKVPIHHRLIELGFLEYKNRQRGALFPGVEKEAASGQIAKAWGQWFGRYKTSLGIVVRKDFHSFRHTFIDACREAGVDSELRLKITGHAPQVEGEKYGTLEQLRTLKREIDRVGYQSIESVLGGECARP